MRHLRARRPAYLFATALLLLASCRKPTEKPSSDDSSAQITVAEPGGGPVTAKAAFAPLFKYALGWSSDVQPLAISSKDVPGFPTTAGRAPMWAVIFASPSKHQFRIYAYSIAAVPPDIYKGIEALPPDPWAGPDPNTPPIDPALFTVDSDAAYRAAAASAAAWLARNPAQPLTALALAAAPNTRTPVWSIAWGDKKSRFTALVNATTGALYHAN